MGTKASQPPPKNKSEAEELLRLMLDNDDVLVLSYPRPLSRPVTDALCQAMTEAFPGHKGIILERCIKLGVTPFPSECSETDQQACTAMEVVRLAMTSGPKQIHRGDIDCSAFMIGELRETSGSCTVKGFDSSLMSVRFRLSVDVLISTAELSPDVTEHRLHFIGAGPVMLAKVEETDQQAPEERTVSGDE